MGLTFAPYDPSVCCLCGSSEGLTGEHKVKASALRSEFGNESMVIGRVGESEVLRAAQGPKSKSFHFSTRVCGACNNRNTQKADLEFDRFNTSARALWASGKRPRVALDEPRYAIGSAPYLNLFRYFAKLLCCHLAEVGAPRSLILGRFAVGRSSRNCVWLAVDEDWTFKQASAEIGPHQYAAHGGLVVYGHVRTGEPRAFHSTLTIGAVRYVFYWQLNWLNRLEIKMAHPDFYHWCRGKVEEAKLMPLSETEKLVLGLAAEPTNQST
ncbi:MAG: hypothetical protein Q8L66_08675 [Caulobacter sp.]|nr:hypothetical protein [Caulobacter sp.]